MQIEIISFGYTYGMPNFERGHGGFVFDCRLLPNPYWDESLRNYNGLEQPVQDFFKARPLAQDFIERLQQLVFLATTEYQSRDYEYMSVAFGCTGGRHRSVYTADTISKALTACGYQALVSHRDISRHLERVELA